MTRVQRVLLAAVLPALIGSCSDIVGTSSPSDSTGAQTPTSALVLSKPLPTVGLSSAAGSVRFAQSTFTYASLPAGTALTGVTAVVRNRSSNTSATVFMFGGGFDPTPIPGTAGDTLSLVVHNAGGTTVLATLAAIPTKARPIVIRTSPPRRKSDIPLNAVITVVFSEPLNPGTLTSNTMRLLQGTQPVAGEIILDTSGTRADFVPQMLLDPGATYTLSLTSTIADVSGDQLEPTSFEFTTSSNVSAIGMSQIALTACVASGDAVDGEYCGIHIVNADGTGLTARSAISGRTEWDASPAWSPNGKRIAFSSWRHCTAQGRQTRANGGDCQREIYVMDADGSGIQRLTDMEASDSMAADYPAWSPDGATIAFTRTRFGTPFKSTIYLMNPDGSGLSPLFTSTVAAHGRPSWSPDGTRMAFTLLNGLEGSENGVYVTSENFTVVTRITTGLDGYASWSPTGNRIAFQRRHVELVPDSWHHIHVVDPDGSNETQLTIGSGSPALLNLTPSWSPDGTRIVFSHVIGTAREVHIVNPDGSGRHSLMAPVWTFANLPAWSPFGTVPP